MNVARKVLDGFLTESGVISHRPTTTFLKTKKANTFIVFNTIFGSLGNFIILLLFVLFEKRIEVHSMLMRLLYSRYFMFGLAISIVLSFSAPMVVGSLNSETSLPTSSPIYFLNQENATFVFLLTSTEIVRGESDLIIGIQFTYENGTFITDSDIYFNITNPSAELVFERSLLVNTTELFNETVIWSTFNSQPDGNYSVVAVANSTTTDHYIIKRSFNLNILPSGRVRMFFPSNPAYIQHSQSNDVRCLITNIGGETVTNVTVTNQFDKTGTQGSVIISHSILDIALTEGTTYEGFISFYPDTYLYQKYSFSISYRTIAEPEIELILSSDPIEIIVPPDILVDSYFLPENVTMGRQYSMTFDVRNNQSEALNIVPHIECNNILFSESISESIVVSPGIHHFSLTGDPQEEGNVFLWFWVELEWETIAETKWYSTILPSVIHPILIIPKDDGIDIFNPIVIYGIILGMVLLSVAYFSRDIVTNIAKRGRVASESAFAEASYPLDAVILDGSNIAWEEKNLADKPKISNVEAMINRLSRANFAKIITVADAALRYQIDNQKRLDRLVKEGAVKMLPARVDGDKFILRLAEEENAMIVSNDMFKEFRETAPWIDQRRIPYTILDDEVYLHPTSAKLTSRDLSEEEENESEFI